MLWSWWDIRVGLRAVVHVVTKRVNSNQTTELELQTRTSALPMSWVQIVMRKSNGSEFGSPPGTQKREGNYSHVAQIREANTYIGLGSMKLKEKAPFTEGVGADFHTSPLLGKKLTGFYLSTKTQSTYAKFRRQRRELGQGSAQSHIMGCSLEL